MRKGEKRWNVDGYARKEGSRSYEKDEFRGKVKRDEIRNIGRILGPNNQNIIRLGSRLDHA